MRLYLFFVAVQLADAFAPRLAFRHMPKISAVLLRSDAGVGSDSVSGLTRRPKQGEPEGPLPAPGAKQGEPRVFDTLLSYPCVFQIKVIGVREGNFTADIISIIARVTGVADQDIKFSIRVTESAKYQSMSIDVPVSSADMLYACYDAVSQDKRVRFKF